MTLLFLFLSLYKLSTNGTNFLDHSDISQYSIILTEAQYGQTYAKNTSVNINSNYPTKLMFK